MTNNLIFINNKYDFPVCNHQELVEVENLGYIQGLFSDGIPYEAELYARDDLLSMAIIMPELCSRENGILESEAGGVTEYDSVYDDSEFVLAIGMVDRGYETDIRVVDWYISYLEEMGMLDFWTKYRNGVIQYLTDINGNDYVEIFITLMVGNDILATTPVVECEFKEFPINIWRKNTIRKTVLQLVKR